MKHLDPMILKTWDEWESDGFHVIKGEKAVAYNGRNLALFTRNQVTKIKHHNYGYDYEERKTFVDEKREPEPKRVYYADGSGYVDFGGPNGPLYFDRNGDS